jgi:hypothetical protein
MIAILTHTCAEAHSRSTQLRGYMFHEREKDFVRGEMRASSLYLDWSSEI